MNRKILSLLLGIGMSGCSTLDQSLQLGGSLGAASGAAATLGGFAAAGKPASFESVAIGAGVGAIVGLAASYFTHKNIESDRKACEADQIEMHFGDLPPSPFVVPKPQTKKGSR